MNLKSIILSGALFAAALTACNGDDDSNVWDQYADWRELNVKWIEEQAALTDPAGKPIYTKVVPRWNRNAYVLMRWFNDTTKTSGNFVPLYTSTVDVKYYGELYNKLPFDSSYTSVTPGDSLFRCTPSGVIKGWAIALERMHVGDSVEVLVPYEQGYGSSSSGKIQPYSALNFKIKLVNVAGEYIRPNGN